MSLDRRLSLLEAASAPREAYHVLELGRGESVADAWAREHPKAALPAAPLVVLPPGPGRDCDAETWAIWARAGDG
jgi:hypothetical protein